MLKAENAKKKKMGRKPTSHVEEAENDSDPEAEAQFSVLSATSLTKSPATWCNVWGIP